MDRELERLVGDRAEGHCEYCRLPTLEWLRFQFDHIIAEKHHGPFEWNGVLLVGRSPIGRTTIDVLRINHPRMVQLRRALREEGVI